MFSPTVVFAVSMAVLIGMFLIAWYVERSPMLTAKVGNSSLTYVLTLGVYATAWTFYGSVGKCATSGMLFLPIYTGPTLMIIFWWMILRKLVRIKERFHITSIADFISARYNSSRAIAAVAALIVATGLPPYVALQIKGLLSSFGTMTQGSELGFLHAHLDLIVVTMLGAFVVLVGSKRLDPTERHPGIMASLAVSCVIKLVAFVCAGVFVTYGLFNGFGDIFQKVAASPAPVTGTAPFTPWITFTVLAMSAIMFLPRDFHVAVVENLEEDHIRKALWMFPLYLFLINIFVYPIAAAGLLQGLPAIKADTFVLALPLNAGARWLGLLVFVGGLCASAGMIMIESMAISIIASNHLLLPVIEGVPSLRFLRRYLLQCRWFVVVANLAVSYLYAKKVGASYMLVNIGMISFAAVLQFAPVVIGGLFWRAANKRGALLGLTGGFVAWFYTLLMPSFIKSGWLPAEWLSAGPAGIGWLNPEHLLGMTQLDGLSHGVFWSMLFNIGLYVFGSLYFAQKPEERLIADEFVDILSPAAAKTLPQHKVDVDLHVKKKLLNELMGHYIPMEEAHFIIEECLISVGINGKTQISVAQLGDLNKKVQVILNGLLGAANARKAVDDNRIFTPEEKRLLVGARSSER